MALFLCVFSLGARAEWEEVWSEDFEDYASTYWLVETGKWTKDGSCSIESLSSNSFNSTKQLKLGTKNNYGMATTPAIGHAGHLRLTFNYIRSSSNETPSFSVSVTGGGSISETETSFSLEDDTYRSVTFYITNATVATMIQFSSGTVGGALIDNIVVEKEVEASVQTVEAPTFTPSGGTYTETQTVIVNCETAGATIYYTTDGTTPTNGSTPYSEPISVSTTMTLKAIAYKDNVASDVTTATFTVNTNYFANDFSSEPTGYKELSGGYTVASKINIGRSAILTFRLRGRTASAEATLRVVENYKESGNNQTRVIYNNLQLALTKGEWKDFQFAIPMQYDNSTATVNINGIDCDLDDVLMVAPPTITLSENDANTNGWTDYVGQIVDVATSRTLRGGIWNTLCLPFDVDRSVLYTALGTGQTVVMTTYSSYANGVMTFSTVSGSTVITAGTPFLLKIDNERVNPTFRAVTIQTTTPGAPTSNGVTFQGCFSSTPLATDGTDLFIGTDNNLYSPAAGKNNLGGLRAYIHKVNPTARLALTIEETTGIVGTRNEERGTSNDTWYTLDGRKVVNGQLKSGLYISKGKKIIVKN